MGKSEKFTNRARTTLNGAINNLVTTLTAADGSVFPTDGNFRIRLEDEIMIVGARSGNTLSSITRGAEGTSAASHADGTEITHPLTAGAVVLAHEPSKTGGVFIHPNPFSIPVMLQMPCNGRWTGWKVLNRYSGSVQYDVWRCTPAQYDAGTTHPVDTDSITASDQPKTVSDTDGSGSCTGWTVDFNQDDIFWIVCDSGQSVGASSLFLTYVRSE